MPATAKRGVIRSVSEDVEMLSTRTMSSLRMRSGDGTESILDELSKERRMNLSLIHQILPYKVAQELRAGKSVPPEPFNAVTIFFSDIVGFTNICSNVQPIKVVKLLNELYTVMDYCVSLFPLYKVETIGDAYMVVGGLPDVDDSHAEYVANFALLVQRAVQVVKSPLDGSPIQIRMGIHSGPVVAGVVGNLMPRYCLFGDTVHLANKMESNSEPGRILLSEETHKYLNNTRRFDCCENASVIVKGIGTLMTHWLMAAQQCNSMANEQAIVLTLDIVLILLQRSEFRLLPTYIQFRTFKNNNNNSCYSIKASYSDDSMLHNNRSMSKSVYLSNSDKNSSHTARSKVSQLLLNSLSNEQISPRGAANVSPSQVGTFRSDGGASYKVGSSYSADCATPVSPPSDERFNSGINSLDNIDFRTSYDNELVLARNQQSVALNDTGDDRRKSIKRFKNPRNPVTSHSSSADNLGDIIVTDAVDLGQSLHASQQQSGQIEFRPMNRNASLQNFLDIVDSALLIGGVEHVMSRSGSQSHFSLDGTRSGSSNDSTDDAVTDGDLRDAAMFRKILHSQSLSSFSIIDHSSTDYAIDTAAINARMNNLNLSAASGVNSDSAELLPASTESISHTLDSAGGSSSTKQKKSKVASFAAELVTANDSGLSADTDSPKSGMKHRRKTFSRVPFQSDSVFFSPSMDVVTVDVDSQDVDASDSADAEARKSSFTRRSLAHCSQEVMPDTLLHRHLRVMVVEDKASIRSALRMLLEQVESTWIITVTESADDALKKLKAAQNIFDVVFVGANVKKAALYNHELVDAMRNTLGMLSCVVVAYADPSSSDGPLFVRVGVDEVWYFPLPSVADLREKVRTLLQARQIDLVRSGRLNTSLASNASFFNASFTKKYTTNVSTLSMGASSSSSKSMLRAQNSFAYVYTDSNSASQSVSGKQLDPQLRTKLLLQSNSFNQPVKTTNRSMFNSALSPTLELPSPFERNDMHRSFSSPRRSFNSTFIGSTNPKANISPTGKLSAGSCSSQKKTPHPLISAMKSSSTSPNMDLRKLLPAGPPSMSLSSNLFLKIGDVDVSRNESQASSSKTIQTPRFDTRSLSVAIDSASDKATQLKKFNSRKNISRTPGVARRKLTSMKNLTMHSSEIIRMELLKKLERERELNLSLLHQLLPAKVADDLRSGKPVHPEAFKVVTVFFSDIVGFFDICASVQPFQTVQLLNELYTVMDHCVSLFPLYKVETIGDNYMVVGGLPEADDNHAKHVANFALLVQHAVQSVKSPLDGKSIQLRMGISSGPILAGVVGNLMPRYCLFGDTVNTSSRMKSNSEPGKILMSKWTYRLLMRGGSEHAVVDRGRISVKGKGLMQTYWLDGGADNNSVVNSLTLQRTKDHVTCMLGAFEDLHARAYQQFSALADSFTTIPQLDGQMSEIDEDESSNGSCTNSSYNLDELHRLSIGSGNGVRPSLVHSASKNSPGWADSLDSSNHGSTRSITSSAVAALNTRKQKFYFNDQDEDAEAALVRIDTSGPQCITLSDSSKSGKAKEPRDKSPQPTVPRNAGPLSLLLIEDSCAQRKRILQQLKLCNPSWHLAYEESYKDALKKLSDQQRNTHFDVVFVDDFALDVQSLFSVDETISRSQQQEQQSDESVTHALPNKAPEYAAVNFLHALQRDAPSAKFHGTAVIALVHNVAKQRAAFRRQGVTVDDVWSKSAMLLLSTAELKRRLSDVVFGKALSKHLQIC